MRLDDGGQRSSIAELMARYGAEPWIYELEEPLAEDAPVAVRRYAGLETDEPVTTGEGPYVFVIDGDLTVREHASFWTDDARPGRVIVTGNLHARSLSFGNGARVIVRGDADVDRACFGQHGERNAVLDVAGTLTTPALLLDQTTAAYAYGGLRGLIYADCGFWEELAPDIVNSGGGRDGAYFRPEVLSPYGAVDFDAAIAAVRSGDELFLPGVPDAFPGRLHPRHT